MTNEYRSHAILCAHCKRSVVVGAYTINGKLFLELTRLADWLKHNDLFFCTLACVVDWTAE